MKKTWSGPDDLKKILTPISKLKEDPENLNVHNGRSISVIKASLSRFGQQKPVVVTSEGVVKAGNGLLTAAKELGWSHVAASTFEGTEEEAKAFGIADNQSQRHSFFRDDVLDHVTGLMDQFTPDELGGWDPSELKAFELPEGDFESEYNDEDEEARVSESKSIRITEDQWTIVSGAIELVRDFADETMSEGRCIELICADYISGRSPSSHSVDN